MTRHRIFDFSVFATLSFVIAASSLSAPAQAPAAHPIIKFNVPGAGTGSGQGTVPFGIVAGGSILGWYIDSSNVYHGFLRSSAGVITPFDAPGAGTGSGQGTFPQGINSALVIVGTYVDTSGMYHGFRRSKGGEFTQLDDPKAGTGSGQGTWAGDINTKGEIVGAYIDSNTRRITAIRARRMVHSTHSMLPARAQVPARARFPTLCAALPMRERLPGATLTQRVCITDSCALPVARSKNSSTQ
jgi:hypothetical protein